jgi:hypothetical protein
MNILMIYNGWLMVPLNRSVERHFTVLALHLVSTRSMCLCVKCTLILDTLSL